MKQYVCDSLALIIDFVVIDQEVFGPIALSYDVKGMANMLYKFREQDKVQATLQYFERIFPSR